MLTDLNFRLRDIAEIRPGYLSRGRIRSAHDGTHRLLQAKDVSESSGVLLDQAVRFHPERKPELYQVDSGDILIVARGQNHRAFLIKEKLTGALAAASFYIVRPKPGRVVPSYLAWFLNRPSVQTAIDTESRGTSIRYISRKALEALIVQIPSLSVQENIEKVLALWQRKKSLQSQIDSRREKCLKAVLRKAIERA